MTPVCSFREFCCLAMSIEDLSLADNQSINQSNSHTYRPMRIRARGSVCARALYTLHTHAHTSMRCEYMQWIH